MGQVAYERPREKLQRRGVSFLNMFELVQLVIGAGNAKMSGAKLARVITPLLEQGSVSFKDLIGIEGLGVAKACQLLASIEIGRRVSALPRPDIRLSDSTLNSYRLHAMKNTNTITIVWFDGSYTESYIQTIPLIKEEHVAVLTKRIFSEVVMSKARYGYVALSLDRADLAPLSKDVSLVHRIKEVAALLDVTVIAIDAVNKRGHLSWYTMNMRSF